MAQARAPPGTVGATTLLPECLRQIKAAWEPRRRKPEDSSGGDGDDDGKRQHAPADGDVIEARQAFGNKLQQEFVPESLPRLNDISISWGVLAFAIVVSVAAGTIFGLAPAWLPSRLNLTETLRQEGRGSNGSRRRSRLRHALVIGELALGIVPRSISASIAVCGMRTERPILTTSN